MAWCCSPEHTAFEAVFQRLDVNGSKEITWSEFERLSYVDPRLQVVETKPRHQAPAATKALEPAVEPIIADQAQGTLPSARVPEETPLPSSEPNHFFCLPALGPTAPPTS